MKGYFKMDKIKMIEDGCYTLLRININIFKSLKVERH